MDRDMDIGPWLQFGFPAALLVMVVIGLWKLLSYACHKCFDDDSGLVVKWVAGEMQWRTRLTERLEVQQEQCAKHVEVMGVMDETMKQSLALEQANSQHLSRLVQLHEDPGRIGGAVTQIDTTSADVVRMKRAAIKACELCRKVADKEFPGSAADVDRHCDEIERIIGEA